MPAKVPGGVVARSQFANDLRPETHVCRLYHFFCIQSVVYKFDIKSYQVQL